MAAQWPDFTADNVAFAQAKAELPGASLSDIAQRAQRAQHEPRFNH